MTRLNGLPKTQMLQARGLILFALFKRPMTLLLIVLLPFVGSLLASLLPAERPRLHAWLAAWVALACVALVLLHAPLLFQGETLVQRWAWMPAYGLEASLRIDGFSWLFALIVSSMGGLIALYAHYYLSDQDPARRFFAFLQAFMGAMLGVVLAGNVIQLVVFWELTSLFSFMLIAYWYHRRDARRGARMALIMTGGGGLCLLAGALMLGHVVGSYDIEVILQARERVLTHAWYPYLLILLLLGAFTKSAQFPFHIWLPRAMAAPTPVSAYLHSATMVKLGVFLLARFWPVLSGTDIWLWLVGGTGLLSLTLGGYLALFQRDMKGVLAYSTISHLGLITLLLGLNSKMALVAAIFHIINHATFKASLFMAAGIVDHETGTRNLNRLSGLRHAMPMTATLAVVAAAAMAGVPLLNGFLSKEMFFAEALLNPRENIFYRVLPIVAVLASVFSVAYSFRFIQQVFFGPVAHDLPRQPHEPALFMLVPSAVLVLICFVVGVFPGQTVAPVLHLAVQGLMGTQTPAFDLRIWHGWNLPLLMSVIATLGGVLLIGLMGRWRTGRSDRAPLLHRINGRVVFDALLAQLERLASGLLRWTSTERLQPQVVLLLLLTMAVALLPLAPLWPHSWSLPLHVQAGDVGFAALWLVGGVCALAAAYFAKFHRPAALLLVGGAGLVTSLTFAWLSAPDLALTQLAVEAVTMVLILLGLRWLPKQERQWQRQGRWRANARHVRDLLLAAAAGLGLAGLSWALMVRPAPTGLATEMLAQAQPLGGGSNVVNVILVDFRGFDTFGEITVLGVVALSVYALLRRFRPPVEAVMRPLAVRQHSHMLETSFEEPDPHAELPEGHKRIPAVLVRLLLPVAMLLALYFLLRGHDLPGGGFVAGLVMAAAIILQYMFGGVVWVEARPWLKPQTWLAAGMLTAAGAGMLAWADGRPFLSARSWHWDVPWLGRMHMSTVLLFDAGVFMLVVGSTMLILVALAHQSLRFYRVLPKVQQLLQRKQEQGLWK